LTTVALTAAVQLRGILERVQWALQIQMREQGAQGSERRLERVGELTAAPPSGVVGSATVVKASADLQVEELRMESAVMDVAGFVVGLKTTVEGCLEEVRVEVQAHPSFQQPSQSKESSAE
jgi:C4-type Zn-finger protein